jgi:hypothetical protein
MAPHVIIVGADKGGVGKTTVSRTLLDYFDVGRAGSGVAYRAFDTETPLGVLKRFFPDLTQMVDLTRSDDQMKIFDTLKDRQITVIDVRAGLLTETLKTLSEIGYLSDAKEGKLKITVLHVVGSSQASFDEIKATAGLVEGAKHYLVINHANDASYLGLSDDLKQVGNGIIDIPKLDELAAEHVDGTGASFGNFMANEKNSTVMRRYVKAWLAKVFKQFDDVKLAEIY